MTKTFAVLAVLAVLTSLAAIAAGININPAINFDFTDCASGGSSAQTLSPRTYLMRVTTEDVWICLAESGSTCVSGGLKFPAGTVMMFSVTTNISSVSCRSAASTGDIGFTHANS